MALPKRQRIECLSQVEWLLRRPETYIGGVHPRRLCVPVEPLDSENDKSTTWQVVDGTSPALDHLANEMVTNAVDNRYRDTTQRYIKIEFTPEGSVVVSNDGSAIPIERFEGGDEYTPSVVFSRFQSGSNFDDSEVRFTAGRNGIGATSCNAFAKRFVVDVTTGGMRFVKQWERNMSVSGTPSVRKATRKTNLTQITWDPDYARLVVDTEDAASTAPLDGMRTVVQWLAQNAALCAPRATRVSFNGAQVGVRTPEQMCKTLGGVAPLASETVTGADGRAVLRLCVAAATTPSQHNVVAYVNSTPCCEGTHVKWILQRVADIVEAKAKTKGARAGHEAVHVRPSDVRAHAIVVAVLLVENPRFTSQTKEELDTPVSRFGWTWREPSAAFRSALERSGLVDAALADARHRDASAAAKETKVARAASVPTIPKYDAATRLYKGSATLLVTEGDSAKSFAVAGLAVTGRRDFGVFPIRGKFLNVRGMSAKAILANEEARRLVRILGLEMGKTYTRETAARLPYASLTILSDMDTDGSHIAGLLINLIATCFPSLLHVQPRFVHRFATALIRVTLPRTPGALSFASQVEYDAWRAEREARGTPTGTAKFFKGLGSSSAALAKEYFNAFAHNTIVFEHTGDASDEAVDLFFNKKRAASRRAFLTSDACRADSCVDYAQARTTLEAFVHTELLPHYARASQRRAIPSAIDGLKEAQRKILFGARKLRLGRDGVTTKVSIVTGKISAISNYHHGEASLADTVIAMAIDYTGTGNINLLVPDGQFGTRHDNGSAAAPRYICTGLNDPVQSLLYPPADDAVLAHAMDEGADVEPAQSVPVIAAALCFGAKGIATGWSTDCPMYSPIDLVDAAVAWLDNGSDATLPPLLPWWRGFTGTVARDADGVVTVRGVCKQIGSDVHVTDVPPMVQTDALVEHWRQAEGLASRVEYGDGHSDEAVHVILRSCAATIETLGLCKRVGFQNMHFFDADGFLRKYESADAIVRAHAQVRLRLYATRLAHECAELEKQLRVAENRARFVEACVEGALDLRAFEDEAAAARALRDDNYDATGEDGGEGSFAYLLRMPLVSVTRAKARELRRACDVMRESLRVLRSKTPEAVWRGDLRALRDALAADGRYGA